MPRTGVHEDSNGNRDDADATDETITYGISGGG